MKKLFSSHSWNCEKRQRMLTGEGVEITHTNEKGKSDYVINPSYYFTPSIVSLKLKYKTIDETDDKGKIIGRYIYPLNKDGVPYGNSGVELKYLKDDKLKTGRVCIDCFNAVLPIKNDYPTRYKCKSCEHYKERTESKIIKCNTLC